eukprot:962491-Alexandrium_andersonii.AAC.1
MAVRRAWYKAPDLRPLLTASLSDALGRGHRGCHRESSGLGGSQVQAQDEAIRESRQPGPATLLLSSCAAYGLT